MAININRLTHAGLNALKKRIEARQIELAKERAAAVRQKLAVAARALGFTLEELFGRSTGSRRSKKRSAGIPKYRNPKDPTQTWTGHGRRPRWFLAALKSGKKEKDLLS